MSFTFPSQIALYKIFIKNIVLNDNSENQVYLQMYFSFIAWEKKVNLSSKIRT